MLALGLRANTLLFKLQTKNVTVWQRNIHTHTHTVYTLQAKSNKQQQYLKGSATVYATVYIELKV